jgi:hypothetical protein
VLVLVLVLVLVPGGGGTDALRPRFEAALLAEEAASPTKVADAGLLLVASRSASAASAVAVPAAAAIAIAVAVAAAADVAAVTADAAVAVGTPIVFSADSAATSPVPAETATAEAEGRECFSDSRSKGSEARRPDCTKGTNCDCCLCPDTPFLKLEPMVLEERPMLVRSAPASTGTEGGILDPLFCITSRYCSLRSLILRSMVGRKEEEKGALVMNGCDAACFAVQRSKGFRTKSPCRKCKKHFLRCISSIFCSCDSFALLASGHFIITSSKRLYLRYFFKTGTSVLVSLAYSSGVFRRYFDGVV